MNPFLRSAAHAEKRRQRSAGRHGVRCARPALRDPHAPCGLSKCNATVRLPAFRSPHLCGGDEKEFRRARAVKKGGFRAPKLSPGGPCVEGEDVPAAIR